MNIEKNVKEVIEKAAKTSINYGLKLKDNENYAIYPMEYYDVDDRSHFFTMDTYLSNFLNVDTKLASVDTSSVFTQVEMYDAKSKYVFDKNLFKKSIELIEKKKTKYGKDLEILFVTVMIEDNLNIFDFI